MEVVDEFGFGACAHVFLLCVDDHVPASATNKNIVSISYRLSG